MRDAISEGYKTASRPATSAAPRRCGRSCGDQGQGHRGARAGQGPLTDGDLSSAAKNGEAARGEPGDLREAGREDLAVVEREEIAILNEFVPAG